MSPFGCTGPSTAIDPNDTCAIDEQKTAWAATKISFCHLKMPAPPKHKSIKQTQTPRAQELNYKIICFSFSFSWFSGCCVFFFSSFSVRHCRSHIECALSTVKVGGAAAKHDLTFESQRKKRDKLPPFSRPIEHDRCANGIGSHLASLFHRLNARPFHLEFF